MSGLPECAIVYMTDGWSCIGQILEAPVAGQPMLQVLCLEYEVLVNLAHVQLIRPLSGKKTVELLLWERNFMAPSDFDKDTIYLERIAIAHYDVDIDAN